MPRIFCRTNAAHRPGAHSSRRFELCAERLRKATRFRGLLPFAEANENKSTPCDCLHFVVESRSTIGSRPVDPPTLSGHPGPEQVFHRRATCVVIQRSSAFVKAACVPRFRKTEALAVEMMAKLVAEGAKERSERGDLFPDGGPHPETDEHSFGTIVAEQLNGRATLTNSKRPGCKH